MSDSDNLLIVADSERDANMLYAVGLFVPDPFIYFRLDGNCHVVVSDLEVNRMRKRARHCRVISYNQCLEKLRRKVKRPGLANVIKKISAALMMAEVGLAEGMQALKTSKIGRDGKLFYHGAPLTSEKVRGVIDTAILQVGGLTG